MVSSYFTHHRLDKSCEQFVALAEASRPRGVLVIETHFMLILVNLNQRGIGVTIKSQAGLAPAHIVDTIREKAYLRAFACMGYRTRAVVNFHTPRTTQDGVEQNMRESVSTMTSDCLSPSYGPLTVVDK